MIEGQFYLPIWYDLLATFAFGIAGAMIGLQKKYDIVGVVSIALAVGAGGGIIRDGLFLQTVPSFFTDWRYVAVIALAVIVAINLKRLLEHNALILAIGIIDALGLAAYSVIGTQKAYFAGVAVIGTILIGVINAVGGGVIGDVLSGDKPRIFMPGQLYAIISVFGATLFLILGLGLGIHAQVAAIIAMSGMIIARTVVILYDIKTRPAHELVIARPLQNLKPKPRQKQAQIPTANEALE